MDRGDGRDARVLDLCAVEYPRLARALALYSGDPDLGAELAAEAAIRAVDRMPQGMPPDVQRAWLYRVGMNLVRSWWRRRAAERRAMARHGAAASVAAETDLDAAVTVREVLQSLPPRQRQVLILRYFLDLSLAEAASVLGIRSAAAAALTHRAVTRMRAQLIDVDASGRGRDG